MSTVRALVQIDETTAALQEVSKGQAHCGAYTDEGLMVMRPAWTYEYAYPLGALQTIALSAYQSHRLPTRTAAPSAPQRPVQRAVRGDQCDSTCTTDCGHCKGKGPEPRRAAGWRSQRMASTLEEKQFA